jgi:hypothetical protein
MINQTLQELSGNKNQPSDSIRLIFRLYVDETGKIDSVQILQEKNLIKLKINNSMVISSLLGRELPCLRSAYYKPYRGNLLPDNIIVVYDSNSKFLFEE